MSRAVPVLTAATLLCSLSWAAIGHEAHPPGAKSAHVSSGVLSAANNNGPKTAKHLRIGMWNTAANITTYTIGNSWNDWVLYMMSEKLLEPSPYLSKGRSWLATEVVQVSEDARIWEAEIRKGVKWHDGSELTAEDVAFTYNLYLNGPANRWTHHVSDVPRIEKITAIGPYRVRFEAPRPMPNFDLVTAPEMPILQKQQWDGIKDPRTMRDPVIGTGPYKLADYKADEYYHLVAHKDYWGGKPLVDEITLVMIKDPQTMFSALKSGEIDGAARALPPELVEEWKNDPAIEIVQAPSLWGTWIQMNLNQPVFNDRELRYAMSLAINADEMTERVMLGRAQSGKHGWPHLDSTWTKPGMKVPYDVAQSKAGLDAAGIVDADGDGFRDLKGGKPIDFRIVVSTNQPLFVRAAELMVKQLRTVGIKSHVKAVDDATFNNLTSSGDYEFSISEITPHGLADQDQYMQFYSSEQMRKLLENEPDRLALYDRWWKANTRDDRLKVSHELQQYENRYPSRFMLWYPDGIFAYRWQSYDNYASSFGYGIYHKYSFLPEAGRIGTTESVDQLIKK